MIMTHRQLWMHFFSENYNNVKIVVGQMMKKCPLPYQTSDKSYSLCTQCNIIRTSLDAKELQSCCNE